MSPSRIVHFFRQINVFWKNVSNLNKARFWLVSTLSHVEVIWLLTASLGILIGNVGVGLLVVW